jgi:probable rRNA maturation factor
MATSREPRVSCLAASAVPGLSARDAERMVRRAWERHHGPPGAAVEVSFLGEEEHSRLHSELLGDPSSTDVMAIPYRDPDLWGEILVNADCAAREARARGVEPRDEALLYVAHGALHLLGLDDRDPAARAAMRAAERSLLPAPGGPQRL